MAGQADSLKSMLFGIKVKLVTGNPLWDALA